MKKTLIVLAMLCAVGTVSAECYSEGVRIGTIQKFAKKGFVTKSWEGELVMDGFKMKQSSTGAARAGNVWAFSVDDASVAKVIDEATMSGGEIALRYCQNNPLNPLKGLSAETSYRVTQAVLRK